MTIKAYMLNLWNAVLARPLGASVERPSESGSPASAFAGAGGWVLGALLSKREGYMTTYRNIIGYQYDTTEAEALGAFVARVQRDNEGFAIENTATLQLPPAAGEAPNNGDVERGGLKTP